MQLPKYAYFQGAIVPYERAKVSVLTHALNYGTAAFGGLRGYWNEEKEQLFVFRPNDHFRRLLNSAKLLHMHFDHTPETLTEVTLELLRVEGHRQDVYIRPLVYKADEGIGVRLHDLTDSISIVSMPFGLYVEILRSAPLLMWYISPVKCIPPAISSFVSVVGFDVPMPTLPLLWSITILSEVFPAKVKAPLVPILLSF